MANGLAEHGTPFGGAREPTGRGSGAAAIQPGESLRQIDSASEPPRLLRTTANLVEVGVNDPAHGWLEVRAQSSLGQIHASLGASSPEAQSALSARLPELAGYLADREIGVRSLAVEHGGSERGSFADMGGGSGGQGREPSGGAHPEADGRSGAEASRSSRLAGDTGSRSRSGEPFLEAGIGAPLASGRGAAAGYSPHTINVLA